MPPPGETPRRTGTVAVTVELVVGTVEAVEAGEELAADEVVVVLGLVVVTVVAGGFVGDEVDDDAVVGEDAGVDVVEPSVVDVWVVGSAGEVFGAPDVGSDGPVPAGTSEVTPSPGLVEVVESPSLKGRRSGSSPVTHPARRTARTIVVTTRSRTQWHRQIGPQH